jgi:DNA-binding CsgD family transcriptional regulator
MRPSAGSASAASDQLLDEALRLLDQAAGLIRAHRAGSPSPETWRLTPREADVLRLLREGRSNREIATALGISLHTARTHVSRVLAKLYVRSRWQLIEIVDDARVSLRVARRRPSYLMLLSASAATDLVHEGDQQDDDEDHERDLDDRPDMEPEPGRLDAHCS